MTILAVTQLQDDSDQFDGQIDYDTITIKYRIDTDGSYTYSYQVVRDAIAGNFLPARGEAIAAGEPYLARRLSCQPVRDAGDVYWLATVVFDNQPIDNRLADPNSRRYTEQTQDPDDPTQDLPLLTHRGSTVQRPANFDRLGEPVLNTAGDLIDPLPELLITEHRLEYEFNTLNQVDYTNFIGAINGDRVKLVIGGEDIITIEPLTGLIEDYETTGPNYRYKDGVSTEYFTHRIGFNVIEGDLPSKVEVLDPATKVFDPTWTLYRMDRLERPDDPGTNVTYFVQGDIASNVGLNTSTAAPTTQQWLNSIDYTGGTNFYTNNTINSEVHYYRAIQDSGPSTTAGAVEPGVADNWRDYWQEFIKDSNDVGKRRILQGEIDPFLPIETALQPIDNPAYLDRYGRVLQDQSGLSVLYGIYFETGVTKLWSELPWFTSLLPPP